jgi:hypothetical protein
MVSMPLDLIRMLLDGALQPCKFCCDNVITHENSDVVGGAICESCLSDCDDDEIEEMMPIEHIDAAREFNAAMAAARKDGDT